MKSNQTIEQVLETVNNSPSTIFHKEDVLRLLTSISMDKNTVGSLSLDQVDDIVDNIVKDMTRNTSDIATLESVTVSAGSYGNGVDDVDIMFDADRIADIVRDSLFFYTAPAGVDSTGSENNPSDNQTVSN